jgi:hypothetical protein
MARELIAFMWAIATEVPLALDTMRLVMHSIINANPEPFGPSRGNGDLRRLRIRRRIAVRVERPSLGNRLSGPPRLAQHAHRDDARSRVEPHRAVVASRNLNRDRSR